MLVWWCSHPQRRGSSAGWSCRRCPTPEALSWPPALWIPSVSQWQRVSPACGGGGRDGLWGVWGIRQTINVLEHSRCPLVFVESIYLFRGSWPVSWQIICHWIFPFYNILVWNTKACEGLSYFWHYVLVNRKYREVNKNADSFQTYFTPENPTDLFLIWGQSSPYIQHHQAHMRAHLAPPTHQSPALLLATVQLPPPIL